MDDLIIEFLADPAHRARIDCGGRWLVVDNTGADWPLITVYAIGSERTALMVYEGANLAQALKELKG